MSLILQNLATPAIGEAIVANFTEEMACFGRGLPQGELHKTPELLWFLTPLPGFSGVNENIPLNQELTITEIEDLETLKILCSIEKKGFGTSAGGAQVYYDTYANTGFGKGMSWHHYLGWLYDEPVAITSLLFHAGVAGIYGVATIPEARRQGVGAAMTLHTLREARKQGYRVAVLSPTDMSIALYRRIGFQEYCKLLHYAWSRGQ